MEALTALGLAANVLQFLEFSTRVLSEANEIYQSATGRSEEQVELQTVARDLTNIVNGLDIATNSSNDTSTASNDLLSITLSAKAVAQDLASAISKLAIPGSGKRKWKSFRQALLTLWNKDKIDGLQKRLENLRNQLSIHVLSNISKAQVSLVADLTALRRCCEEWNSARTDTVKELLDSLQDLNLQDKAKGWNSSTLDAIEIKLKKAKTICQSYDHEGKLLKSLLFDTMRDRYRAIAEAHQQTFHWIFNPSNFPSADPRSRVEFKAWLTSGHGLYWISGKPGSGKSTLMKYICDSPLTVDFLRQWAQSHTLVTAAFYFWAGGTEMQKSQRGLFQQLLFEVLRVCPDLIPTLCPQRWNVKALGDWSLGELRGAFEKLRYASCDTKFCFFIDGLDEYEGDEMELIHMLQSIARSPHIKICVASRPLLSIEKAFGAHATSKLYLHDLTIDDIRRFACDKLGEFPASDVLQPNRQEIPNLVGEITRRSQGVFLWVFLVTRSLREGFLNGDSLALLRRRFEEIPTDLELLFDQLIGSVDHVYREQMATTFDIAIRAPYPLCMLTYWFLDEGNSPSCESPRGSGFPEVRALEDLMIQRLHGRYKGLLESVGKEGSRKVNFIHRTVRDYLRKRTVPLAFAQPTSQSAIKAVGAFVRHAKFCSSNKESRGFNSQDLDCFILFARWAESESSDFDWEVFNEMERYQSWWFDDYDLSILCKAVQYGFTAYLEHRSKQDRTLIHRLSTDLLWYALAKQRNHINSAFGIQSSYQTLVWLLQNGADPNAESGSGTVFSQFVSETGASARWSKVPWAYEQWQKSLSILLQYGARYHDVLTDARYVEALPQIGASKDAGIHNLAHADHLTNEVLHQGLHRHVDIYSAFLEHGLDPNRYLFHFNLWEMWLWHICKWQTDHGRLEDICVRAISLFLSHRADPFQQIRFPSDRLLRSQSWSVTEIVDTFFTQESRTKLRPILNLAKRHWRERYPDSPGESKKRTIDAEPQCLSFTTSRRWEDGRPRKSLRYY